MSDDQKLVAKKFRIDELLASAAKSMSSDLAQQLVAHPGELGREREEVVRAFLRKHLPERFEISTGFVFDADEHVSEQIDIIISDSLLCPRFETIGGTHYYPCESVVAVGQVKSSMTSEKTFMAALSNLESVKNLDRSGGGRAVDELTGEPIDPLTNHRHQMFTFVLVTGRSLSRENATTALMNFVLKRDAHLWPNVILALDQYLLTYCCDAGVCPNPLDARGIASQAAEETQDLVMRFYLLLASVIEVTAVSRLPYHSYLRRMGDWTAKVYHSSVEDDPPPFLSSIVR